jgi:glycosidase
MADYVKPDDSGVFDMMFCFKPMEADCIGIEYMRTPFNLPKLKRIYNSLQTKMYGKTWNTNFLENHDRARIVSRYGNEAFRKDSAKALAAMYTFLSGSHFIYQGQEIGMTNYPFKGWEDFADPATFTARDLMTKVKVITKKGMFKRASYAARDNSRTPVQWTDEANAGFTTEEAKPWYLVNPNYTSINVAESNADENSILNFYRQLLKIRKEFADAAVYGKYVQHCPRDKQIYLYDKLGEDGTKLTVITNLSPKPASTKRVKKYIDALIAGGAEQVISNLQTTNIAYFMRPYETHVYVSKV